MQLGNQNSDRLLNRFDGPTSINWNSWQTIGLKAFFQLTGPYCVELLSGIEAGISATRPSKRDGPDGFGYASQFTRYYQTEFNYSGIPFVTDFPFTLSCWWNPVDNISGNQYTAINISDGYLTTVHLGSWSGSQATYYAVYASDSAGCAGPTHTVNNWQLLTARSSSSTSHQLFVNGVQVASRTNSITLSGLNQLRIGRSNHSYGSHEMGGGLAHACVWARALSDAEIFALYDPPTRWDLYYPLARKLWSFPPSSAAAPQNATPESATVTITGIDPAVAGSSTATATPNPVSVTTTGVDPSASGSGTITGNPDASSVTVVASDPSATPSGSAPTSPEVASITITGVDPATAGSGSSAATPDAASINVSSIAPQASGVGTSTATPDVSSTTVSAVDTSASGSGTGTAVPNAATVTVSAVDAAASFVGAGTGTADVATVTISGVAVTATPGPVTIIPDVATSTTSTADAAATAIGTATANPDFGLVSAAAANSAGSGFGITTFTPAVATIVVTSSDAAGTPSGSVAASPDVATATVTALDCAVAATGAATASPDAATVTVFSQSASAEGGIVVLGPFYVDAAQTLMAGPDVCQALTAGAEEWQSVTAGTGVGQTGVP